MTEHANHDYEAARIRERSSQNEGRTEQPGEEQSSPVQGEASASRLATSRAITGRGNGPVRENAMLSMQKTQGNRAIQRAFDFGGLFNADDFPPNPYNPKPGPSPTPFPPNPYNPKPGPSPTPFPPNPYKPKPGPPEPFPPNPYVSSADDYSSSYGGDDYSSSYGGDDYSSSYGGGDYSSSMDEEDEGFA